MRSSRAGLWVALLGWSAGVLAVNAEQSRWVHLENSVSVGYDDNVSYSDTNKVDRFEFRDRLVLSADRPTNAGAVGLRLGAEYLQYDRSDDLGDQDYWNFTADLSATHSFSRRLTLGLQEAFFYSERPEVQAADGTLRRPDSTYYYNTVNLNASSYLTAKLRADVSGRWHMLRYSNDTGLSNREDYDIYSAGLTLGVTAGKDSMIGVEVRYEDIAYVHAGDTVDSYSMRGFANQRSTTVTEVPDRGSSGYSAGLVYSKMLNPALMGNMHAGWMYKEFNAANQKDDSSPYGDVSLTYLASPATRATATASYSLYQSGMDSFVIQQRTAFSLSLAHDFTAKISGTVIVSYMMSEYDSQNTVDVILDPVLYLDGTEDSVSTRATLSYRINRRNWLSAGYTYTTFNSDTEWRTNYSRNRYDVSWTIRL